MTDKILEISDKLRADEITSIEARNLLLGLFIVSVNEVPFNMANLMDFYSKSKYVFNSPISDVINAMLNER